MVPQVSVIGILMIVNGSLQLLMGILYAVLGPVMFSFFSDFNRQVAAPPGQAAQMQQFVTVFSIVYVVLGAIVALAGVLNIAGGISAVRFRSRAFVITALFFNIAPLITCYCLPTSLGLMIWGLIVMFQSDVAHAFTLGASGYTADEIKERMSRRDRYPQNSRYDDWDERGRGSARGDEPPRPDRERPVPKGPPDDEHIYPKDDAPTPKPEGSRPPPAPDSEDERFSAK